MKHFLTSLLAIIMVLSFSFTAFAGGEEFEEPTVDATIQDWIDQGYPVVSRVTDSCKASYAYLATDQMGDYLSVFVEGNNINKNTVKPVFYDDNGNVISGDVEAVETVTSGFYKGAYFRIKKLDSPAWSIENTNSVNLKNFKVSLEAVGNKEVKYSNEYFQEKVQIYRRDVYYTSFDSVRETLTLYFSTDVHADTETMPTIILGYPMYDNETGTYPMNVIKEATAVKMTRETNKFTGQTETKAVFSLKGFDYNNAFDNWSPMFTVTFKNTVTNEMETYSLHNDSDVYQVVGRSSFFPETNEESSVKGNSDVILYYPYWIGGVYKFPDTGSSSRYLITKEDAEYLENERFSYASYIKGKGSLTSGDFKGRQYSFAFFTENDVVKPQGVPTASVTCNGELVTLSWSKVEGASGYKVYVIDPAWTVEYKKTTDLSCTFNKYMLYEVAQSGVENIQVRVCAYSSKNSTEIDGDLSNPITIKEIEAAVNNGGNNNENNNNTNNNDSPVKAPTLNVTSKSLNAGKTVKLSVANANGKKVEYKSNKKAVATVSKTGVVTALKKGTAKISAKIGGKTLTCTITVKNSPTIKYNKKVAKNNLTINVKKGKTAKLIITGKASTVNNKVTTSKKAVAKITSNPKNAYVTINALKKGKSTIKVTINNSVTYKYTIKVK